MHFSVVEMHVVKEDIFLSKTSIQREICLCSGGEIDPVILEVVSLANYSLNGIRRNSFQENHWN